MRGITSLHLIFPYFHSWRSCVYSLFKFIKALQRRYFKSSSADSVTPSLRKSLNKIPLGMEVCVCVLCVTLSLTYELNGERQWKGWAAQLGRWSEAWLASWGEQQDTTEVLGISSPPPFFLIKKYFTSSLLKKPQHIPKAKQPTTHSPQDIMFSYYICLQTLYLCFSTEILRWHNLCRII